MLPRVPAHPHFSGTGYETPKLRRLSGLRPGFRAALLGAETAAGLLFGPRQECLTPDRPARLGRSPEALREVRCGPSVRQHLSPEIAAAIGPKVRWIDQPQRICARDPGPRARPFPIPGGGDNPGAVAFYEACGFVADGARKQIALAGARLDEVRYRRDVPDR